MCFVFRMDPCVRKPTTPAPVFAPRSSGGNNIEEEIEKIINEETIPNENGKRAAAVDPEKNDSSPPKKSKEDGVDIMLDLTISGDEETSEKDPTTNAKEITRSSTVLKDLIEAMEIEQTGPSLNSKSQKTFKSNEFVYSSSDTEKEDYASQKCQTKQNNVRKTITIPHMRMDGRNQCKYIFKRGSNMGTRCPKTAKKLNEFCLIHSKDPQEVAKKNTSEECQRKFIEINRKLTSMEEYIESQRKKINEDRQRLAKSEHIVANLRKTLREYETRNQELQNKIDHILELNKSKPLEQSISKQIDFIKFKNLDKTLKYKLVEFNSQYIVLSDQNSSKFKIVTPKSIKKPNEEDSWNFVYKFGSAKWDWEKDSLC